MKTQASTFNGKYTVSVYGQSVEKVVASPIFQNWLNAFDHEHMELKTIIVQSADFFANDKVVFIKMEADVVDRTNNNSIPGIVFLRGNAVAILTVIVCKETHEKFFVITKQPRAPLGIYRFYEIVAGMLDKNDGPIGRAVGELKEETGITVSIVDLVPLGSFVPSAGGCDERINIYMVKKTLGKAKIDELLQKKFGVEEDGESITLELLTPEELVEHIQKGQNVDAKILATIMLFMAKDCPNVLISSLKKI